MKWTLINKMDFWKDLEATADAVRSGGDSGAPTESDIPENLHS
jgi:hypothetical protein